MAEALLKYRSSFRAALALSLVAFFILFAFESRHWEWMNDEQVFRYIQFLINKGLAPYREITDINMPGSYLSEFVATSIFGTSDFGFRVYDYVLLIGLTLAAISIARPYDWFGGVFGGVLFALIHGSEGPWETAERDEVMTVLLMIGFALAFLGVRRRRPSFFLFSALSIGISATIKPTALLFGVLLLVLSGIELRKHRERVTPYLSYFGFAILLLGCVTLAFFLWRGSLGDFVHSSLALTAYYSTVSRVPLKELLHHSTPRGLIFLLPLGLYLFWSNRSWRNWEFLALAGAAILGLASYFIQDKGFEYHRYPFVAFALVWCGLEFGVAVGRSGWGRRVGVIGLVIGVFGVAPFYLARVRSAGNSNTLAHHMMDDLRKYPAGSLEGRVQCLDGLDGCYSALYRLGIKQSTGLMGDQLLFSERPTPPIVAFRKTTLSKFEKAPPLVIILSNYWYGEDQSFDKLNNFPELAEFLHKDYNVVDQYPALEISEQEPRPAAYRVYQLR